MHPPLIMPHGGISTSYPLCKCLEVDHHVLVTRTPAWFNPGAALSCGIAPVTGCATWRHPVPPPELHSSATWVHHPLSRFIYLVSMLIFRNCPHRRFVRRGTISAIRRLLPPNQRPSPSCRKILALIEPLTSSPTGVGMGARPATRPRPFLKSLCLKDICLPPTRVFEYLKMPPHRRCGTNVPIVFYCGFACKTNACVEDLLMPLPWGFLICSFLLFLCCGCML